MSHVSVTGCYGRLREDLGCLFLSVSVCVGGYGRLREVTGGYGRLREVTGGYGRLREVTGGYERLREVTGGYGRLREVTGGYGRLREVTGGYGELSKESTQQSIAASRAHNSSNPRQQPPSPPATISNDEPRVNIL